jgi:hypothetical protein
MSTIKPAFYNWWFGMKRCQHTEHFDVYPKSLVIQINTFIIQTLFTKTATEKKLGEPIGNTLCRDNLDDRLNL